MPRWAVLLSTLVLLLAPASAAARRPLQQDALSNSDGCLGAIPKCEPGACATRNVLGVARWVCLRWVGVCWYTMVLANTCRSSSRCTPQVCIPLCFRLSASDMITACKASYAPAVKLSPGALLVVSSTRATAGQCMHSPDKQQHFRSLLDHALLATVWCS